MNRAAAALLLAAMAGGAACSYRAARVPALGESVRVVVTVNDARLVRAQAELQRAVAMEVVNHLGWRVEPTGSAKLELTLGEEHIAPTATTARDVPTSWIMTLHGQTLLTSRHGAAHGSYTGNGYVTSLGDEPEAIRTAAEDAAAYIVTWIEHQAQRWPTEH
jgi:hypothetical protein